MCRPVGTGSAPRPRQGGPVSPGRSSTAVVDSAVCCRASSSRRNHISMCRRACSPRPSAWWLLRSSCTAQRSRRSPSCPRSCAVSRSGASCSPNPMPVPISPVCAPRPSSTAMNGWSPVRRSGPHRLMSPTGACCWPAPTSTPRSIEASPTSCSTCAHRASRCGRSSRPPAVPSSTRCSSKRCASPWPMCSARSTAAGVWP